MRRALIALILTSPLIAGCAAASPVQLNWSYPRFNAVEGTPCAVSPDTLKDLARVQLWRQSTGQSDSTLVLDRGAIGKEASPDSVVVQQQEGVAFYWAVLFDNIGNRSCRSNLASRTVIQSPSPAVMK
jgi:hypothetical protein